MTVALSGLAAVALALTLLWIVSLRIRDVSIVDPFWAPGFALVALVYVVTAAAEGPRVVLMLGLTAFWAGRLGLHLLLRNRKEGEDPRYAAMRRRHGDRFGRVSLFTVFWLQALLLWLVSAPLLAVALGASGPLGAWDVAGGGLAALGLIVEGLADAQLKRFRADPGSRGRVLDTGLWRYSRHPNYFGNAVFWWGLYILAVAAGGAWSVYGPALMTVLLLRVSGVTLLEEGLRRSRPGYDDYVRRTSAFVPWFPKAG